MRRLVIAVDFAMSKYRVPLSLPRRNFRVGPDNSLIFRLIAVVNRRRSRPAPDD